MTCVSSREGAELTASGAKKVGLISILDPQGETLAFGSAGDGVKVFSYRAGYAGRGVEAREPGPFSLLSLRAVH